jgi:hypothetical protein
MLHYRAFGVTIASHIDLLSLDAVTSSDTDAALTVEVAESSSAPVSEWFHDWRLGRNLPRVSFGRTDDGYLVRFDSFAEFAVSVAGTVVRCPDPEAHAAVPVEHLLLDQVVPLALARQGHLLLHGSAVHVPGVGAVAVLGRSRRGKSTLASALARHAQIIADDCVRIDDTPGGFHALPSYPALRLWDDSRAKVRFNLNAFPFRASGSPLRAVFVLGARAPRGPAAAIRAIPAPRAFVQLARHQFQLDVTDRCALARSFHMLTALVAQVPVYRLRVRDNLDAASDAAAGVVQHLLGP